MDSVGITLGVLVKALVDFTGSKCVVTLRRYTWHLWEHGIFFFLLGFFFWHSLLPSSSPMSLGNTVVVAGAGPAGVVAPMGNSGVENTSYFVALA